MEMGKDMGEDFRISGEAKIAEAIRYDIRTTPCLEDRESMLRSD